MSQKVIRLARFAAAFRISLFEFVCWGYKGGTIIKPFQRRLPHADKQRATHRGIPSCELASSFLSLINTVGERGRRLAIFRRITIFLCSLLS